MTPFLKQCAAEFLGTFFLVFIGCGAVVVTQLYPSTPQSLVPVAFGGVISVMIYAVGHISGAHFNPAVTLGFAVARHFPARNIFGYITAQCLGAIGASALHALFLGRQGHHFGVTAFHIAAPSAFGFEMIMTFLLMFVIISVATDTRAKGETAGLAIGTTVAICSMVGGPLTGASMNPARSLAPALISGQMDGLWLYMVAPWCGALLGAIAYEKIRNRS